MLVPYAAGPGLGAVLIAAGAFFTLRAVWQWERTRLVVTTEKVYLLNGTLHRRSKAVRLQLVDAVEVDQSLVGQLFGYGTVVVGPLRVRHSPARARFATSWNGWPRSLKRTLVRSDPDG